MIQSKEDFKRYVAADREKYHLHSRLHDIIYHYEEYYIVKFLYLLRKVEYLQNCELGSGLWAKLKFLYYTYRYTKMSNRYGLYIAPNVCGPGLYIAHLGLIRANHGKIGANCTLRPGVIFAANYGVNNPKQIHLNVGDNVEFSLGCKILCDNIGDNVIVGPNAVVLQDIPANHKAIGNPAVISPRKRRANENISDKQ